MKTLALANGDLVVGAGGHRTVSGSEKVRQEIALALGEYWGTDRFHADQWGSVLTDYLGQPIDTAGSLEFDVRTEIARVLANYVAIQTTEIYNDYLDGRRSRFDTADVIRSVDSIDVAKVNDSFRITIALTTAAGLAVTLNRTVTA